MRIVKIGNLPEKKIYGAKCGHCKTEIEFEQAEARQSADRNCMLLHVDCPLCKREIVVQQ